MSGEQPPRTIDVAALLAGADALSREAGARLAREVQLGLPDPVTLDFSHVLALNSAFMSGMLLTLLESLTLVDLRELVAFQGLYGPKAEVVRKSIRAVRALG